MKVGDTVKLKPAMWQGIKPESYGLSFTGEYVVKRSDSDQKYPSIQIEGSAAVWDAGAFQLVVKEKDMKEGVKLPFEDYSLKHYDYDYKLTATDIERGSIRVDTYFVSNVWKVGSKDDSGALWHCLKTINRFGEKNTVEREIKAIYNQAKALARIYGVELE